jgi:hypothetical protein
MNANSKSTPDSIGNTHSVPVQFATTEHNNNVNNTSSQSFRNINFNLIPVSQNNNNNNNSNKQSFRSNNWNNNINTQKEEENLLKDLLIRNFNLNDLNKVEQRQQQLQKQQQQPKNEMEFFGFCRKCKEKIIGGENGVRAMDELFHVKCFCCHGCNSPLQGKHFYAMDTKSFCESCYMRLLEKCSICSKPITNRILRATGLPFHPECFCCVECNNNLDGIPFTVDATNKIHCIDCFHQ